MNVAMLAPDLDDRNAAAYPISKTARERIDSVRRRGLYFALRNSLAHSGFSDGEIEAIAEVLAQALATDGRLTVEKLALGFREKRLPDADALANAFVGKNAT